MLNLNDSKLLKNKLFIDGEWVDSDSGNVFNVVNPATGKVITQVASGGKKETCHAINSASNAMQHWQQVTAKEKALFLQKWYQLIIDNIDDLAVILTSEQGKPIAEAKAEVQYGASYIEWFAEEAKRLYGDIIPSAHHHQKLMVIKRPVGVVAAITPWNFPIAMITRKIAPALAAGCSVVIKPSELTPLSALALMVLAERAGLPKGLISVIPTHTSVEVGKVLTDHPKVKKLSFTGSTSVGKSLIKQCADTVKKVSMELGGNAPFIVFDDADIELAVEGAIASKFRNAGQTCVCANRFLVHRSIYQAFTDRFAEKIQRMKVGNGIEPEVTVGPLINQTAVKQMGYFVSDAISKGAKVVLGTTENQLGECFYLPTLLTDVTPDMQVFSDEIFGPIAPVMPFDTEEQALELANMTEAGLASYIYTKDYARIWRFSEQLEHGMVGVNEGMISSEVVPFGGVKESGNGREGSKYGLDDYTEIKYICLGGLKNKV